MVIGPTPPGTGVSSPVTSRTSSKATSPTSRDLPSVEGTRLIPTSMTQAPGLIHEPRTISGRPTAATRISAWRAIAAMSLDFECAIVTVLATQQQLRHRLTNDVGAPDHHGVQPGDGSECTLDQHERADRCAWAMPPLPLQIRPAFSWWKPSTSLAGAMREGTCASSIWDGDGGWTRMPFTESSAFN